MIDGSRHTTSDKPLAGRRIVVTRAREQASEFVDLLEKLGADVIPIPTIRIDPPGDAEALDAGIRLASEFDFVVFTSANGVAAVRGRIEKLRPNPPFPCGARVCAVGPATAREAGKIGLSISVVPEGNFNSEGLLSALRLPSVTAKKFLIFRAGEGRDVLPDELRKAGATVRVVVAYKTVKLTEAPPGVVDLLKERPAGAVTFTSPSTFKGFAKILGPDADRILRNSALASIGPVTSAAISAAGYAVAIEPKESTIPALVDAISGHFSK